MAYNTKALIGKLIYRLPMGRAQILESNKPFSLLQQLKKEYARRGYKKEYLKITY